MTLFKTIKMKLFVNVVPISNLHCMPSELLDNRRVKFQNNFMLCTGILHYFGIKISYDNVFKLVIFYSYYVVCFLATAYAGE